MSLVACPECAHQVSTRAFTCPGCGYPMPTPAGSSAAGSAIHAGNAASIAKTAGTVAGIWLTAPWVARLVFGVVAVTGLFTWLIVAALVK